MTEDMVNADCIHEFKMYGSRENSRDGAPQV